MSNVFGCPLEIPLWSKHFSVKMAQGMVTFSFREFVSLVFFLVHVHSRHLPVNTVARSLHSFCIMEFIMAAYALFHSYISAQGATTFLHRKCSRIFELRALADLNASKIRGCWKRKVFNFVQTLVLVMYGRSWFLFGSYPPWQLKSSFSVP